MMYLIGGIDAKIYKTNFGSKVENGNDLKHAMKKVYDRKQ